MDQTIRFVTTSDGVKLAYGVSGAGPALFKAANWMNHLEYDWQSPVWRHWFTFLSSHHRLVRYDARGCGLSDWTEHKLEFDWQWRDLECVVEAAGLSRFALLCLSQGAAAGIEYAVRHPQRVSHLIILGGYALGWAKRGEESARQGRALAELIRFGWGQEVSAFRKLFAELFVPDATPEQISSHGELMRRTTRPEIAARILEAFGDIDVRDRLHAVKAPTLVMHARGDRRVPFDEGRAIAAGIPGAQFLALDTNNHILTETEPAWERFRHAVLEFLGTANPQSLPAGPTPAATAAVFSTLTPRELEIITCVASGASNSEIASRLRISDKTVRNHMTTIYAKLGVNSRAQAIVFARAHGLLGSGH
jgi:pimeloyl-ACP methyl ester carboxylesterase/DNA-binding CsgD family transcriptional regulator